MLHSGTDQDVQVVIVTTIHCINAYIIFVYLQSLTVTLALLLAVVGAYLRRVCTGTSPSS